MQIEINGRHFTLGDDQRATIARSLAKVEKFSSRPVISVQLNIDHDAGRFAADAVLHLKAHEFRAGATASEPEIAAAEVVENLRSQLIKFKGKMNGKHKGEEGGLGAVLPGAELSEADGLAKNTGQLILKDMDLATAEQALQSSGQPFFVFRNVASQQLAVVYRKGDGTAVYMESAGL